MSFPFGFICPYLVRLVACNQIQLNTIKFNIEFEREINVNRIHIKCIQESSEMIEDNHE
jgi:hypothetical protein